MSRQIYLNRKLSDYFDLPYENEGEKTTIHTSALDRAYDEWDEEHQAIIDENRDLKLRGEGYGWWEIIN